MKWIRIGIIIVLLFVFVPVTADVIFPAKIYGFTISNLEDYSGYYVIAYPVGPGEGYHVMSPGRYTEVGEDMYPRVFAVRKTDLDPSGSGMIPSPESFFRDRSRAIPSPQFKIYFSDFPVSQLTGVYETYRIVSINTTAFDLARTERIFLYDNGSEKSVWIGDPVHHAVNPWVSYSPVITQETGVSLPTTKTFSPITTTPASITPFPVPGDNRTTPNENPMTLYQYFLIPLVAAGVIAAILIRRHKK